MASAIHHADVAQDHLLVFSSEAQPISEPGVGEARPDVGLPVLSQERRTPSSPRGSLRRLDQGDVLSGAVFLV